VLTAELVDGLGVAISDLALLSLVKLLSGGF
jgi:hypothetical protein